MGTVTPISLSCCVKPSDHELGEDVLARLAHRRVLPLEPWDAARSLFGVQRMDAAFGKDDAWIAAACLSSSRLRWPPQREREQLSLERWRSTVWLASCWVRVTSESMRSSMPPQA